MLPAHELLRQMPRAKREAAIRAANFEILVLLESIHNAVGFPKEGSWSSMVCLDLEAVRQHILNPKKLPQEPL